MMRECLVLWVLPIVCWRKPRSTCLKLPKICFWTPNFLWPDTRLPDLCKIEAAHDWNNLNLTGAGLGGYGAAESEVAQELKREKNVDQKKKKKREEIMQVEKKHSEMDACVKDATVAQLRGVCSQLASRVLAEPIAATGKTDKKKKKPNRPKKSATVLPIRPA